MASTSSFAAGSADRCFRFARSKCPTNSLPFDVTRQYCLSSVWSRRSYVVGLKRTLAQKAHPMMSTRPDATESTDTRPPSPAASPGRIGLIDASMTVAEAFVLLAESICREALDRAHKLDRGADPEDLHKLRVAMRRLRTLWWAYDPLLDKHDAKLQRREFKSLADAAGRTRDWDVLHELIAPAAPSSKHSFAWLIEAIEAHRTEALSFSLRAIGNAGVERILQQAVAAARAQLEAHGAGQPITGFAEERVQVAEKALKKRVKRAIAAKESDYGALHEVRIAGKKLRYLLQFFAPVLDGGHQAVIEHLTVVQDELGTLNDQVTSEALLREYAFQLGEAKRIKEAIAYLQKQTADHMHRVHEILCKEG
ncbi:CHAD domain-containing protein [Paraburkholderia phenazinium]|uniref:CHAD domain-containing protein n=1 Tax=Paraburkholderia phenazinium TaxID=60549 RepID=UPI00158F276D|nr:CHAD domain-containing protein [Paraburkholderia phenazinium]